MITVMGATGQIGGETVRRLIAAGEEVRALGRVRDRLAPLAEAGAIPLVGDAADETFLTEAFAGADAVQVLQPIDPMAPDYLADQQRIGAAIVAALRVSGVRHVVALSSVGADVAEGNGIVATLHDLERRLRPLTDEGVDILALRSGSYFENFAHVVELARAHGIVADSVDPDLPVPMVATRDVAAVAAAALRERDWVGWQTRELLGPRLLGHAEATRILGAALGLPDLAYVRLPAAELAGMLREAGFVEPQATLQAALGEAWSDGTVAARERRSALNTTPTTFEEYVAQLARAQGSDV